MNYRLVAAVLIFGLITACSYLFTICLAYLRILNNRMLNIEKKLYYIEKVIDTISASMQKPLDNRIKNENTRRDIAGIKPEKSRSFGNSEPEEIVPQIKSIPKSSGF